ncbi:MAG TPA: OB-fold nucleic acid binding domain-containing protein [Actinomycetales bacterium]|nr:OB-fold nucleic acid binding domain-containing protein [Actinomycetales bacterium]
MDVSTPAHGRLRSALTRLTSSRSELDAAQDSARSHRMGGTPCGELTGRRRVVVAGTLRSVTLRPRAGVPALEAEISDGTGTLSVIWLGRREIHGVEAGRWLRVDGLVACSEGRKVIYNPRYQLLPGPAE